MSHGHKGDVMEGLYVRGCWNISKKTCNDSDDEVDDVYLKTDDNDPTTMNCHNRRQ